MLPWRAPAKLVQHWLSSGDVNQEAEPPPLADAPGQLERWVLSLPWVERAGMLAGEERAGEFAVVCPPLGCRSVWLFVTAQEDDCDDFDVYVVLPRQLAQRGVAVGWAASLLDLTADRVLAGIATPTTPAELSALQALLGVAYSAAFHPTAESDPG
jgi:hypothetical protein